MSLTKEGESLRACPARNTQGSKEKCKCVKKKKIETEMKKDEKKQEVEEKEKCFLSRSEDREIQRIRSGFRRQLGNSFLRQDF